MLAFFFLACLPQMPVERLPGDPSGDRDGDGWAREADCNDQDPSVFPGADEICDGLDQDCDDWIDEGLSGVLYVDDDGDGYGAEQVDGCWEEGLVEDGGDCVDDDPSVHPGADETCDGADQDCDDQIDEDAVDAGRWYQDRDGDGHGAGAPESACSAPSESWTELGSDCDDADVAVNPDAAESCNGVDDDCSGAIDDGADCPCTRLERAGSSYLLCSDDRPWTYASEACEDLGYHLVHIESASENDWLASELGSRRVWGGASDRDDEGTWRDTLGSALVFEAWASGEPNGGYGENCLELNRWRDGLWNDASCWSWQPYVCEAD